MKSIPKIAFAALAATILLPAMAQVQDSKNQGYLVDAAGNIVRNATGLCWHDSDWTPARSVEPCDPVNKPLAVAPKAPEPVMAAAASPPEPAKLLPQKVSFDADAFFDFGKSTLKPGGKATLDDLVRQLNGATYNVIYVTGHTDRLGRAGYNQNLSVRRANEVKSYLMSKDVQASRIEAKGVGSTQPLVKASECRGPASAKVIACLQPDRRVEIEMEGTKTMTSSR